MPRRPRKPKRRRRGSGSVVARPDGTWWAIPPPDLDPGRKPRRGFATKAAAEAWLDAEIARARASPSARPATLEVLLSVWFARTADSAGWSDGTRAVHASRLRRFAALGPISPDELRPGQVQEVVAEMARRGLTPTVIRQSVALLRRALADALDDGYVRRNVAARLVLPKGARPEPRAWTRAEARRVLQAVRGEPLEALAVVGLVCGLRIGELLGLQWDDLDHVGLTLTVRRSFSAGAVGPTKTRRERTVRLPAPVWAALLRHRERQNPGEVWVFPSDRKAGRPLSYTRASRWLRGVLAGAGVRQLGTHSLRHSAGSAMLSARVDPALVAEYLGHASPAVTMSTYWSAPDEGEGPAEAVVRWLGGAEENRGNAEENRGKGA